MSPIPLGIMTLYNDKKQIEERSYFQKLTSYGMALGLHPFVFTPQDVDHTRKRIYAHVFHPDSNKWKRQWTPFPTVIFDRCRYQPTIRFKQLRQFRKKYPRLLYLNRPLANKWHIHQLLWQHPDIRPFLPRTERYRNSRQVLQWLTKMPAVFVKPVNGTGGRGILKISNIGAGQYHCSGRDRARKMLSPCRINAERLKSKLKTWCAGQMMMIQQGINIELNDGRVHDYRILIQKNRGGTWEITGGAGRIGAKNSITSNLHGGGKAVPMITLMKQRFSDHRTIDSLRKAIDQLAHRVVQQIESHFGSICELALDIAIDRSGHLWLLEINPKPSREIFARIGDRETYVKAIKRPLEYALFLYEKRNQA